MVKINGIDLEDIDLLDADTAEMVEESFKKVTEFSKEAEKITSMSEMIRKQCDIIRETFDDIFGDGTSEKIFGNKDNLRVSANAFSELMEYVNKKRNEVEKECSQYSPNRALRRQNKK